MKASLIILLLFTSLADAAAQIPNGDFEHWQTTTTPTDTFPTGWTTSHAGPSRAAFSGNYALTAWNWYSYAGAWAALGKVDRIHFQYEDAFTGGIPWTTKPRHLYGQYMFDTTHTGNAQGNDSAAVVVIAKRFNVSLQKIDTVAVGVKRLGPATRYTPFAVDITDMMPGTNPDSIAISIFNCLGCICKGVSNCLYLHVDNLSFTAPTEVQPDANNAGPIQISPNPASGNISIRSTNSHLINEVLLSNSLGIEVIHKSGIEEPFYVLPVHDLPAGMYYIQVSLSDGSPALKQKVVVMH